MAKEGLYAHLATGTTTVCRCWHVERRDGVGFGFTDHDEDIAYDGIVFRANTGLTARALQQTTGLAVDNTEAMGALSDAAVSEADILAGRFDGAEVQAWMVNWANVSERALKFKGSFGEIVRAGGAFQVDLRGLTQSLNQPQGRVYQRTCSAILGNRECRFDVALPGYFANLVVEDIIEQRLFRFATLSGFDARWFERGRLTVLTGTARKLVGVVKNDRQTEDAREIELWQSLGANISRGDEIRIEAGCDKRAGTCQTKFNNYLNFRDFPHIPGHDWLTTFPSGATVNDGGSLVD